MAEPVQGRMSPAEYLAFERASPEKHEYWSGELLLMSGASRSHNRTSVNLAASLHGALRGTPCEVFAHDMRVRIDAAGAYAYPDLVVSCDGPRFADRETDTLLNPRVVVEVLSPSTERHDRGRKANAYRSIASLRELVLVSQDEPLVEVYRRHGDGFWALFDVRGLDAVLELESIGCRVPLAEVYDRVAFAAEAPAPTVRP